MFRRNYYIEGLPRARRGKKRGAEVNQNTKKGGKSGGGTLEKGKRNSKRGTGEVAYGEMQVREKEVHTWREEFLLWEAGRD